MSGELGQYFTQCYRVSDLKLLTSKHEYSDTQNRGCVSIQILLLENLTKSPPALNTKHYHVIELLLVHIFGHGKITFCHTSLRQVSPATSLLISHTCIQSHWLSTPATSLLISHQSPQQPQYLSHSFYGPIRQDCFSACHVRLERLKLWSCIFLILSFCVCNAKP